MALYANISCALPRDMAGVKPLTRLVFIEAVLYCRENLTDGLIDRRILPFIAVDVPNKHRHLDELTTHPTGFLDADPDGWRIPLSTWCEWNPLKAEVDEHRRAEAERKAEYRERKRRESQRDNNGTSPSVPTGHRVTVPDTRKQPEPEPERKPEPEQERRESSSVLTVVPDAAQDDDDDRIGTFEYVVRQIVDAKEIEYKPRKPRAWRHATRRNTITEDGDLITRMLEDGTGPNAVALFVLGHGLGAVTERATSTAAWCGDDCPHCDGTNFVYLDTNGVPVDHDTAGAHGPVPCPNRPETQP